jgi:hypothetical protein
MRLCRWMDWGERREFAAALLDTLLEQLQAEDEAFTCPPWEGAGEGVPQSLRTSAEVCLWLYTCAAFVFMAATRKLSVSHNDKSNALQCHRLISLIKCT